MKPPLLFLCYPKCSTCAKARKWLDDRGIAYETRDIKTGNPNAEEIDAWRSLRGLPVKKFFNTSGNSYRNLGLKDKLPYMSESEQIELLASDGMLVKRPILVGPDFALVGFNEGEWERVKNEKETLEAPGPQ
jgi:arsenate reductase